ncbi:hypothetical protein [Thiohalorhabdus sp.]|uniref:hypothetical protein n=1 Tax=Thiohalorhabdus sp. TaxID=3094134 RepID=UPI002FC37F27
MRPGKQIRPARQARILASRPLLERTLAIIQWRDAAIADGWLVVPKVPGQDWEQACVLHREDFQALCVTRNEGTDTLTIWAPDGMQVPTPNPYDWEKVKDGVSTCLFCGATGIAPHLVGEGGRACKECLAKL